MGYFCLFDVIQVYHRIADSKDEPAKLPLVSDDKSSRSLDMDDNNSDAEWVRF